MSPAPETGSKVVAILRGPDDRHLVRAATVLRDAGLPLVELPLTTPGALRAIERLDGVGAGTVRTLQDARDAVGAGAAFLVTPAVVPDAIAYGAEHGVPVYAGALSPTEVLAAHAAGASYVKIFPAGTVGPGYLAALRQPFPDIAFVPTGGVDLAAARAFLAAGAAAVGVGSPLAGDALVTGDLDALHERARVWAAL
ncbi:bifunctional 4-hydroxy-2-oxoglutarate aldolase/2-dehydro-3-deoxy-phosphogluconate aldolase [Actinomadura sp. NPDC048394]|uniref:bifunctional 4-hydroxy-2-oxoglutarate aldolase/2-dehydro-3-deoxy-phosphogluconate aldolase n=1 Tax=Actinomadura sp. NPDC048394 TaxID=3158223 RepID=UPI0033EC0412